jgi:hypothetical protein
MPETQPSTAVETTVKWFAQAPQLAAFSVAPKIVL